MLKVVRVAVLGSGDLLIEHFYLARDVHAIRLAIGSLIEYSFGSSATAGDDLRMPDGVHDLHTVRPSVYLDQWVWVRLARAAAGRLKGDDELAALQAVKSAAEAGVAFPLTSTHYFETLGITNPRQRADLAAVVAPISRFINLRSTRRLMREQLLRATHECFGRPAFQPHREGALGRGVHWAVTGREVLPKIMIDDREVTEAESPNRREMIRAMAQYAETKMFAGPEDEELPRL